MAGAATMGPIFIWRFVLLKRLLAVLLCLTALTLSGCQFFWPEQDPSGVESGSGSFHARPEDLREYQNDWCYQRLDSRLQQAYGALYQEVKESFGRDETVTISDSASGTSQDYDGIRVELPEPLDSEEEARMLYSAFIRDNPQFFHIGNIYGFDGHQTEDGSKFTAFKLVYAMNASERVRARSRLEQVIRGILDLIPAGADEFQRELILHDELLRLCSYDQETAGASDPAASSVIAFNAYGALVEGKAVCEGYSRAMQLLLERAGIQSTVVTGFDDKGQTHMWNLVTIDGQNYHLDPTWNDSEDMLRHTYFNITTKDLTLTHSLDSENIGVDTCTAENANYYRRTGNYVNEYDQGKIAKVVARQVEEGKEIIDLRFSPDKYHNGQLFVKAESWFTDTVNAQFTDEDMTMWPYDYRANMTYGTITIYKKAE